MEHLSLIFVFIFIICTQFINPWNQTKIGTFRGVRTGSFRKRFLKIYSYNEYRHDKAFRFCIIDCPYRSFNFYWSDSEVKRLLEVLQLSISGEAHEALEKELPSSHSFYSIPRVRRYEENYQHTVMNISLIRKETQINTLSLEFCSEYLNPNIIIHLSVAETKKLINDLQIHMNKTHTPIDVKI